VARVVAVHGINNTYSGPRSMAAEWVPALLDGMGRTANGVARIGNVGRSIRGAERS
jgi:hypothetical protein